jgi:hypothetical protein
MANPQTNTLTGHGKVTEIELTPTGFEIKRVCQDRLAPRAGAKDITANLGSYIPLDQLNHETYSGFNMLGWELGTVTIKARNVYPSYDGKRLVIEVGCNTIIYLQISPNNKSINNRVFLQTHKEFLFDITTRAVAAKVSRAAQPVATIAKYEMYFIMGIFSTVSVPMWLIISGSDLTVTLALLKHKERAFGKLAKTILAELENIQGYAPTLHKEIMRLITSENDKLISGTWKQLPKKVITDEKAQAQTAGILYGKYAVSPKSLSAWGALFTVLIQVSVKSAANLPGSYLASLDQRYASKIRAFTNTNWYDITDRKRAVIQIVNMMKDAKIDISTTDMEKILLEAQKNPNKLQNSFIHIMDAYKEFKREIN